MKFVGHTMGTPQQTVAEAIELYSSVNLDAIEIACQEGGAFWIGAPDELVKEVMDASKKLPYGVITLTPYFWQINNADDQIREENIQGLKDAIVLANKMGAKYVRSYGGSNKAGGTDEENWAKTVEALKEVAPLASKNDVTVLIENHPGTMTRTGQATYELINAVASSNVRALYDPANVMHDTDEEWEHTYEVQKDIIAYVHCKDYFMEGDARKACCVGKGIVPWDKIMKKLDWYDGFVAFEYEKRWYPDQLPDADIGVPQCIDYLKSVL